jgi:copper chaperone
MTMRNERETTLAIKGMSCPSCVGHIEEILRDVDGVSSVVVRLKDGKAIVSHDAQRASVASLVAALREVGYEAEQASS